MKIAIIGAGWAGMAAAVAATQQGHTVCVLEATHHLGGRARALPAQIPALLPDGGSVVLDNGQHILIGAYHQTLALMRQVGVDPATVLMRLPLSLTFSDGTGLRLPDGPAPLDALAGILGTGHWPWRARLGLLRMAWGWRRAGFQCPAHLSVAQLCQPLARQVREELIEPLCLSALNTPTEQASAQVFLRVLQDGLFTGRGGSNLLLPRCDLGTLFPAPAAQWVTQRGGQVRLGARVRHMVSRASGWQLEGEDFDAVILATTASDAARLVADCAENALASQTQALHDWATLTDRLTSEAIATVYAWSEGARLSAPVLALRSSAQAPAQFVFDRGQLGSCPGLLAFVISACTLPHGQVQADVLAQARAQLGLDLQPVQTVVEKRATFACTPGLQRPQAWVAPGLWACGDYVAGPYPATLEGAVRSGLAAVEALAAPGRPR